MSRRESLRSSPSRGVASTSKTPVASSSQTFAPTRSSRLKNELTQSSPVAPTPKQSTSQPRASARRPSKASAPKPSPKRVGAHGHTLMPRAKPDTICAFCGGDQTINKHGRSEDMVACYECGSAGHPTCLNWDDMRLVRKVSSYPWLCQECKRCEVCVEKGDDDDMLFCDSCDRGWHSQCLDPPLEHFPRGKWSCPTCRDESNFFQVAELPKKRAIVAPPSPQAPRNPPSATRSMPRAISASTSAYMSPIASTPTAILPWTADPAAPPFKRPRGRPRKDGLPPQSRKQPYVEIGGAADPTYEPPRIKLPGLKLTLKMGHGRASSPAPLKKREPEPWEWVRNAHLYDDDLKDVDSHDMEEDGRDPYGGALTAAQANPGDRKPTKADRDSFELAKYKAEEKLFAQYRDSRSASPAVPGTPGAPQLPIGQIRRLLFGEYSINTWYQAPFPEEFARVPDGTLWVCEFCLKYMRPAQGARHRLKCKTRHPPGDEIYRDGKLSVWEIDGRKNKMYCQNLCLLAKQFLDHKTLYYDVEPFLFYILTTADVTGAKFIGYFSKEKRSPTNNVSCIMTLPVRQRQGWGQWLIDFSYLLSKKEGRAGTPERPLSGLGAISYDAYWKLTVFRYLASVEDGKDVTVDDISKATSMMAADIMHVLKANEMIVDLSATHSNTAANGSEEPSSDQAEDGASRQDTPSQGRPQATRRGHSWTSRKRINIGSYARVEGSSSSQPHRQSSPQSLKVPAQYEIRWDKEAVQVFVAKWDSKGYATVNPDRLQWSPFLVTRMHGLETQVGSTGIDPSTAETVGANGGHTSAQAGSSHPNANERAPSESGSTSTTALLNGNGHPQSDDRSITGKHAKQADQTRPATNGRKRKLIETETIDEDEDEREAAQAEDEDFVPEGALKENEDDDLFEPGQKARQSSAAARKRRVLARDDSGVNGLALRPRRSAPRGSLNEAALVEAAFRDLDDDGPANGEREEDEEDSEEDMLVADALGAVHQRRSSPRRRNR